MSAIIFKKLVAIKVHHNVNTVNLYDPHCLHVIQIKSLHFADQKKNFAPQKYINFLYMAEDYLLYTYSHPVLFREDKQQCAKDRKGVRNSMGKK